jgi:hypothetical protein
MGGKRRGDGSSDPEVSQIIIDGRALPVFVKRNGLFYVDAPPAMAGQKRTPSQSGGDAGIIEGPSLESLRKKARKIYRAALAIAYPVTIVHYQDYVDDDDDNDPPTFEDFTLIGTKGRNELLVIDSDGEQLTRANYQGTWTRRLDDIERERLTRAYALRIEAERAFRKLIEEFQINPWSVLENAVKTASDAPAEGDEPNDTQEVEP